jgi:hypothetical protein
MAALSLLRLVVSAWDAAGECPFEVAGVEGGEGRDELPDGAVGEVGRAGGHGPAARLQEVQERADLDFRGDEDPDARDGDRPGVAR